MTCVYSEPVVKFLLTNIQQPKLSGASSAALRRICVTCSSGISTHLPTLLQLVQSVDQMPLSNAATNWLIEGTYHQGVLDDANYLELLVIIHWRHHCPVVTLGQ